MCLLTTSTAHALRTVFLDTPGMIEDVYRHNSDGLGVMYATTKGLKVCKTLPKNAAEARRFLEKLPNDDRMVACHWRMKTHGHIDLENCHPYPVVAGTALMHNGILHTGNKADKSKSDTWHFIKDYLAGLTADALHNEGFLSLVGEFIEGNRFAIMSADGRLSVVNKDQGIESHDIWFSNTYAWSPEMLIPGYGIPVGNKWMTKSYKTYNKADYDFVAEDEEDRWLDRNNAAMGAAGMEADDTFALMNAIDYAIKDCEAEELALCLEESPSVALDYIFEAYDITPCANVGENDLSSDTFALRTLLIDQQKGTLMSLMFSDKRGTMPQNIAEALLWSCDITALPATATN